MRQPDRFWAFIGLVFITFLSAIQYVFLQNVPDSVPTFAFVCITNVIGVLLLGGSQFSRIRKIQKRTLKKGILFAVELTATNFFVLLGTRHIQDPVISSSLLSMYFVFVTPLLLIRHKKINFFSSIATVVAIIALMLMFNADVDRYFSSGDVIYLIIADICFACYVVSVSIRGEEEDTRQITFAQMLFSAIFALAGWIIEAAVSGVSISLPADTSFWVSALFTGIFIRVVYGLIQIRSQKQVPALAASLIFASEILITLLINPIMCNLLHLEYTPAGSFQIAGAILFIAAMLMMDTTFMSRLGYEDVKETTYINDKGEVTERSSVARKIIFTTLVFALVTLIASTAVCLSSIFFIRSSAVDSSKELGENASAESAEALMKHLEQRIADQAADKTMLAAQKLEAYSDSIRIAADCVETLLANPGDYAPREVNSPQPENDGKWTMQRGFANKGYSYEDLRDETMLMGNMEEIFASIVAQNDNVTTVYLGTEDGLMVAYDPKYVSPDEGETELYYNYFDASWYQLGKSMAENAEKTERYAFSDTYQDGYGRGLTITCVAPFTDAEGNFSGCVAMDILMKDLNASMVNDGIVVPSYAMLIDRDGRYIAGKDVDENAETMSSIFDADGDPALRLTGETILSGRQGVVSTGNDENAMYIAYSTIDSTDWILCVLTPVSSVLQPAVAIRESIDQNTDNVVDSVQQGIKTVLLSCLTMSDVILILVTLFAGRVSRKISDPLKQLEADVRLISDGDLERRTEVKTDDEIGSLASSFNIMSDSLQKYIADLKDATAKEERLVGEMNAATDIQASMLPRDFVKFCEGKPFTLFASMDPAKAVGGDFYDYFMIDDDHLGLVMADVSGKGVPAALFMVVAMTLIRNRAQMGGGPAEILRYVNEKLCKENDGGMFVTVWFATIELSTGRGLAANAGHEHPTLCRAGGRYELVVYRHGPAVAVMEGLPFKEHSFELHPGDTLFVYTDGVPEATNQANELFGTDRMLTALNEDPQADPEMLLANVRKGIDRFVGDAEQFDDTTMLALSWKS